METPPRHHARFDHVARYFLLQHVGDAGLEVLEPHQWAHRYRAAFDVVSNKPLHIPRLDFVVHIGLIGKQRIGEGRSQKVEVQADGRGRAVGIRKGYDILFPEIKGWVH